MPIKLYQYSRKQTLSLRLSMAAALADFLRSQRFPEPDGPVQFAEVFDEWPAADDRFVTPAACVLPRGALNYAEARLTPTLLEDTWEVKGEPGFGLYALADAECDFEVQVRAPTGKERDDIVAGFERLFVEDGLLMNHEQGRRYGRLVTLQAYFGLPARFSLQSVSILDDQETAIRNRNEAVFVVRAQAKQVRLGPVQPFTLKIVEKVDDELA
jgi:hypothetical protein